MKAETKALLEKLASRKCWFENEDFNPYELAGGNFDDAYDGGYADGEASLAQSILNIEKEND